MSLHRDDLPVLQAALRTRVTEPGRLAEMLSLPVDAVRESLARLTAAHLVVRTADGGPALPPPQLPLVEAMRAEVHAQLAALDAVRGALETMPTRLRHWVDAQGDDRTEVQMELSHGPDAVVDAWWRLGDRGRLVDAFGCFPDAASLARIAAGGAGVDPSADSRIRIITGRVGVDRKVRAAIVSLQEQGIELRTRERMPGWFAGEGGDRSAFPTAWGVSWPLSVRLLRDPVASRSLRSYFDELWRRATPLDETHLGGPAPDWEPVLRLLETGLGDAEIALALGMSERTVRRRIDEAMIDLGAIDRFTLGHAWAAWR